MKVLFMGTPEYASIILKKLIDSRHEIIGVVTQPDKQKGRGQQVSYSPVKELAMEHGIPVYQPVKVREESFLKTIESLSPEAIIVAAFGQILPKALLDLPPYGCINVHASLLPKYRGASPIQYTIIDGETKTGISIMYMDVGIDTGDIILQGEIDIDPKETGGSLYEKLSFLGGDLLLEALDNIENGTAKRIPQDDSMATYVKMLHKDMGLIDFTKSAVEIERLIRGLNPWPSAYTSLEGKILKLWSADVADAKGKAMPGEVIEVGKDFIAVMTGDGALLIKELQLEGRKRMTAEAFLRGYPIAPGMKLGITN